VTSRSAELLTGQTTPEGEGDCQSPDFRFLVGDKRPKNHVGAYYLPFYNHEVDIFKLVAVPKKTMSGEGDNQSLDLGELDMLERIPERFLMEAVANRPSDLQRVEIREGPQEFDEQRKSGLKVDIQRYHPSKDTSQSKPTKEKRAEKHFTVIARLIFACKAPMRVLSRAVACRPQIPQWRKKWRCSQMNGISRNRIALHVMLNGRRNPTRSRWQLSTNGSYSTLNRV